jgi:hypothetical protein
MSKAVITRTYFTTCRYSGETCVDIDIHAASFNKPKLAIPYSQPYIRIAYYVTKFTMSQDTLMTEEAIAAKIRILIEDNFGKGEKNLTFDTKFVGCGEELSLQENVFKFEIYNKDYV